MRYLSSAAAAAAVSRDTTADAIRVLSLHPSSISIDLVMFFLLYAATFVAIPPSLLVPLVLLVFFGSVAFCGGGGGGVFFVEWGYRSKAVGVSATPGFTKSMQEIHLDKTVSEN